MSLYGVELEPLAASPAGAGELGEALLVDPDAEPVAGPDGGVVASEEEDAPEAGAVRGAPPLSQPASNPAPSARVTTTAKIESLIWGPPGLGYD